MHRTRRMDPFLRVATPSVTVRNRRGSRVVKTPRSPQNVRVWERVGARVAQNKIACYQPIRKFPRRLFFDSSQLVTKAIACLFAIQTFPKLGK